MKTIIITGGIATGKSTVCGYIAELEPKAVIFDCDAVVHELLTTNLMRDRLSLEFSDHILDSNGNVDRSSLGGLVFSDVAKRRRLESIVHPAVLEQCTASRKEASESGDHPLFVADVPLYYQVDFPIDSDAVWVVGASSDEQRFRLLARYNGDIEESRVEQLIEAQMPILEKVMLADKVIWNCGSMDSLNQQTWLAIEEIKNDYR
ncbi:MAG: dephospho-CoA kinase [Verrucomicrobiota bacterium]